MRLTTRRHFTSVLTYSILLCALVVFIEFASAKHAAAEKTVWTVTLKPNSQARSAITIRNRCKGSHSFRVTPRDVPYLQLSADSKTSVPGRSEAKVPVIFSSEGMRPGEYQGSVSVSCEDCGEEHGCSQENELIPVHLTITAAVDTGTATHPPTPAPSPRYELPKYDVSPTPSPTPRIGIDYGGSGYFVPLTGKITGYKINDKNCDGKLGDLEPGLAGWTITLKNNGTGATATAVTDANGLYSFNNLPPGSYTISETPQSGWTQTLPAGAGTYTVTIDNGQVRQDFLNCNKGQGGGKITGRKVNDLNCNGKVESNEPGLAGWVIAASNTGGGTSATAVTDANGFYSFNLPAGTYGISEIPQTGWTQTMPSFPRFYPVTLAAGQVFQKDFANCKKNDEKECAVVVAREEAVCKTDGSGGFTYSFTVTNTSSKDVRQILLTPAAGNLSLSKQRFDVPLRPGESTTITVDIGNVKPEGKHCFYLTLMTKDGPCCTVEVCPTLPDCCATATGKFACDPRGGYTGTFTIVNTSPNTIKNIYLHPPAGVTMSQTYFAVTLAPGQSFTTPVLTIKGAPGGRLCFSVSMHTADMKDCCSVEVCIVLPECGFHPSS